MKRSFKNAAAVEIPRILQPPTIESLQLTRRWTSPLRTLPDFLILGAQKAGTTSLHSYLMEHPRIAPALVKEIHFFDYNYARGEAWYRAHFPTRLAKWRGAFQLTGEGSPYYLFHPLAPRRVKQLAPRAKLIALLRNPVERAYSHYHHQVRLGLETLAFQDALDLETERLAGEFEKLRAAPDYYSFNYQNYSYCARGMYADQLERWFRYFPRAQFLILQSETFYRAPAAVLQRVLDFLGAPRWEPASYRAQNEGAYAPLQPEIRARLVEFFAPHNARLYELLKINFEWA